jgi:hypothetical protein
VGKQGNMRLTMKPTDTIPIINYAWVRSFNIFPYIKKPLWKGVCSWYPSNLALLVHPAVLQTKKPTVDLNLTTSTCTYNSNSSSTTLTLSNINGSNGMASVLLESAINDQKNNPETCVENRNDKS